MRLVPVALALSLLGVARAQEPARLSGRSPDELMALAASEAAALGSDAYDRAGILSRAGHTLLAAGRETDALAALEALGDAQDAEELRTELACARADRGDVVGACQLLSPRDLRWWREELEDRGRRAAVVAAPLAEALRRTERIVDPEHRCAARLDVARRFVEAGDPASAGAAVEQAAASLLTVEPGYGAKATAAVARAWVELGRPAAATSFVDLMARRFLLIANLEQRGDYLCELAEVQASLGHGLRADALFDEARDAAKVPPNGGPQTLRAIAAAQARWDRPGALATAAESGSDYAALQVAAAWFDRGQVEEALAVALQADGWACGNDDLKLRIAQRLAEGREVERALEVAARVDAGSWRAAALLEVARAQALAGDRAGALATARRSSTLVRGYRHRCHSAPEAELPADDSSRFAFDDPARWPISYEDDGSTGAGAFSFTHDALRTLCASAMRLRLALGWSDGARFAKAFDGHGSVVRPLAALHGELGQRADAEDWIERLTDPETRAWAILGLSEGLSAR